jgi:hypothetical protein
MVRPTKIRNAGTTEKVFSEFVEQVNNVPNELPSLGDSLNVSLATQCNSSVCCFKAELFAVGPEELRLDQLSTTDNPG